ncbi:D-mannonate oxidoreductase [Salmonella enterica subsp. enterica]|uniref:D-mannonate oxidoreductase n=1 Tax=Salmonella enterica I TaxID=59201 RepID=A0A447MSW6_SALET|nr:D-mannonate oxidoreductase [Salmonella enterica subsp. enterica]
MIAADLQNPHQPLMAPGIIVEALARRKAAGLPAFTVMSCDNMPENGHVTRQVVTAYARGGGCGTGDMDRAKRDISVNHG